MLSAARRGAGTGIRLVPRRRALGGVRTLFGTSDDSSSAPDLYEYPLYKANTIVNTCEQGRVHVVQRFGKFSHVIEGGLYFTIPLVDSIIEHDMREMTIPIAPQTGVTRDNVYTKLSGVLFVQVIDAKKATYGIRRPLISIVKAAEAAMRNALGEMELDECFREKEKLNEAVMRALVETTAPWGLQAKRYEVTDIDAAPEIKKAMNLQAAAERQRRETALGADAEADVMRKLAKAQKQKDEDESLGVKLRYINEAAGEAQATELRAEAERVRIVKEAQAIAEANETIAQVLAQPGGEEALRYNLASKYVDMFGKLGAESNTLFMNQDMGDFSKVLAKGYAALDTLGSAGVLPSKENGAADTATSNTEVQHQIGIQKSGVGDGK